MKTRPTPFVKTVSYNDNGILYQNKVTCYNAQVVWGWFMEYEDFTEFVWSPNQKPIELS